MLRGATVPPGGRRKTTHFKRRTDRNFRAVSTNLNWTFHHITAPLMITKLLRLKAKRNSNDKNPCSSPCNWFGHSAKQNMRKNSICGGKRDNSTLFIYVFIDISVMIDWQHRHTVWWASSQCDGLLRRVPRSRMIYIMTPSCTTNPRSMTRHALNTTQQRVSLQSTANVCTPRSVRMEGKERKKLPRTLPYIKEKIKSWSKGGGSQKQMTSKSLHVFKRVFI